MATNCDVREQIRQMNGRTICYAGGTITFHNPETLHHVKFKAEGGKTSIYSCVPVANLEHTAVHIASNTSIIVKNDIYDYFMDRIAESLYKKEIDIQALKQFNEYLHKTVQGIGYQVVNTKDHLLAYKLCKEQKRWYV